MGGGGAELVEAATRKRGGGLFTETTTGPDISGIAGATAARGVTASSRTGFSEGPAAPTVAASMSGVSTTAVTTGVFGAPEALRRTDFSALARTWCASKPPLMRTRPS